MFSEDTTLREMNSKPKKISLKDDAVLFTLPVPRQIPLAFQRTVKTELDQLVQAGVITPITEATDSVHPRAANSNLNSNSKNSAILAELELELKKK